MCGWLQECKVYNLVGVSMPTTGTQICIGMNILPKWSVNDSGEFCLAQTTKKLCADTSVLFWSIKMLKSHCITQNCMCIWFTLQNKNLNICTWPQVPFTSHPFNWLCPIYKLDMKKKKSIEMYHVICTHCFLCDDLTQKYRHWILLFYN